MKFSDVIQLEDTRRELEKIQKQIDFVLGDLSNKVVFQWTSNNNSVLTADGAAVPALKETYVKYLVNLAMVHLTKAERLGVDTRLEREALCNLMLIKFPHLEKQYETRALTFDTGLNGPYGGGS